MRDHVFTLIERLAPRIVSAGIVFVLAYYSDPFTVGIYSTVLLCYTFVQAAVETAMRQVLPSVVDNRDFLRRYVVFSATVSLGFLSSVVVIASIVSWTRLLGEPLVLLTIAIVPLINSLALPAIGRLQRDSRWGALARSQFVGVGVGAVIALVAMVIGFPLLGVSLFLPVAELVNMFLVRRASRQLPERLERVTDVHVPVGRELGGISGVSSLSWLQGQADRLLLSLLAGAAALGSLSVGSAMARAVSDPVAGATSNLLRVELSVAAGPEEIRRAFDRILLKSLALSAGAVLLIVVGVEVLVRHILGHQWQTALDLVPVLAVGAIFSAMNAGVGTLQVFMRSLKRAFAVPLVALCAAPFIALVAVHDLYLAAWLITSREAVVALFAYATVRRSVNVNPALLASGLGAAMAIIALLLRAAH